MNKLNEEIISKFEQKNNLIGLISFIKKHLKNTNNIVLDSDKDEDLEIKNDMIQFFENITMDDLESA